MKNSNSAAFAHKRNKPEKQLSPRINSEPGESETQVGKRQWWQMAFIGYRRL
jgi:hypothetical protein